MIIFKEELDGNHQWVPGTQLSCYPDWHVVAMAEEETYEAFQEEEITDPTDYYNGTKMLQKQRPVRQVMFLIRQTRDEAMEELRRKAANAMEGEREANEKTFKAGKRIPELEKEFESVQGKLDNALGRNESILEERNQVQDQKRKLEKHLGAVRKELGEAKWRELTEEPS